MKYLFINSVAGFGSTGRIAAEQCRGLMAQGHECVLAFGREEANCSDIPTVRIGTPMDYRLHGAESRLLDDSGFGSRRATRRFLDWVREYDPDVIQGGWLARAEVEEWFYRLCGMSVAERLTLPGMPARRADIIDYGAAVLVAFMRLSGLEGIYVSDRDNLYSAVMLCGGDA